MFGPVSEPVNMDGGKQFRYTFHPRLSRCGRFIFTIIASHYNWDGHETQRERDATDVISTHLYLARAEMVLGDTCAARMKTVGQSGRRPSNHLVSLIT